MNKCSDYLSGTDPVPDNTVTLYDPNNVLPQDNEKVLCKDEMADLDLSMKELASNKETDYLSGIVSVPKNSVTLADPNYVSPQIVVDIEDQLVSNDGTIYLGDTDSEPNNTLAFNDPNYIISPQKLKVLCENETADSDLSVEEYTLNEEADYLIDSNSVSKNTEQLKDPSFVAPQEVADVVNLLISNKEIIYLDGSDSVAQKTAMPEDSNYVSHQVDFDHTDSVPWKRLTLEVPTYPPQQLLTSDEDFSGTNSMPQNTVKLKDPCYVSPQVVADIADQLISNPEIIYLGGTDLVHKKALTLIDPKYIPLPQVLTSDEKTDFLSGTDSEPKNTVSLDDSNYVIPRKKLKVLSKNVTDYDSCEKKLTSNTDTDYLNDASSVPQNTEDPSYVSPQVVADIVDQLISNSEQQKTAIPEDCNYMQHQVDFDHADSAQQKTLAPKDDPNYIPPQQVFENEKDDIVDPRWETVKELTSNEERYKQVKACWGSSTVPDPDKNLTYHSFRRKKILRSGEVKQRVKQHKRKASTTLTNETKRPCTYLVDKEIDEIVRQKEAKSREIQCEMNRVLDELRERHYHEELCYGNNMAFNYRTGGNSYYARTYQNTVLSNLRLEHQRELNHVQNKYHQKTFECSSKFDPKLNDLENIRQEVLQFYTFYKGMGINIEKDPTVLTDFQLKVLNDIENFYKQMKSFYK